MNTALVVGYGVNFVDDDSFDIAKNSPALLGGEENIERFGRSDQDMRRPLQHQAAVFRQRVAGAHRGANLGHQEAALAGHLEDFAEGNFAKFF